MAEDLFFPLDVSWEALKRFNIITHSYSFNEAAKKIGTSNSALLMQMDQLEKTLGYPLFMRLNRNRTKQLTDHGELVRKATEKFFLILSKPLTDQDEGLSLKERLRVITTEGLAKTVLFEPINKFLAKHPGLQLEVMTKKTPELIEPGEVVIRSNFLEQPTIRREFLFSHSVRMYASKDYLKIHGKPKRPYELANHKMLYFSPYGAAAATARWREEFNVLLSPSITSDSIDYLIDQCREGAGIIEVADLFKDQGDLVEVLPRVIRDRVNVYIAYNKKSTHDPIVTEFVDHVMDNLGEI